MGQCDDRPVAASALVAALFRCFCRIMLASDATRVDATSWHLAQHCPVTAVLACGLALLPRSPPRCPRTVIPYGAVLTPGAERCIGCNSAPLGFPSQRGEILLRE